MLVIISPLLSGMKLYVNGLPDSGTALPSEKSDITLNIVTRHDITIQQAFADAFLETDEAKALGIENIQYYEYSTDEAWRKALTDPSKGMDIAWGGGPSLFSTMDKFGGLLHINDSDFRDHVDSYVPDSIAGAGTKWSDENDSLVYIAAAISSFGFTVNHQFLNDHGLPVPKTWEELASPVYYVSDAIKAISMGDPPATTSNTRIYQIILQAFGWEEGWRILTQMGANSGIYPGSVDTRAAAIRGDVGIAMTIDFYGVIAMDENPDCEYIIPEGQSIVNGDPIAIAKHTEKEEASKAFLKYVLSPEGQSVWLKKGIERLPVVEAAFQTEFGQTKTDLYKLYNETIENEGIEFNETLATETLTTSIYYFHNTISVPHSNLREMWGELVTQYRNEEINKTVFDKHIATIGEVDMTLEQAIEWNTQYQEDAEFSAEKNSEWRSFARNKYNDILTELRGEDTEPSPINPATTLLGLLTIAIVTVVVKRKKN